MLGVSDIPCVGKIVDGISDAAVKALFLRLKYMFSYKTLAEDLESGIKKINAEEDRVSIKAAQAKANGKKTYDDVSKWQTEAEEFRERAKEFSEKYKNRSSWRCIQCLPIPNPLSRYQLGREAAQKAKQAIDLADEGKNILNNDDIAYMPQLENLPKPLTEFKDFSSRKAAYSELWKMLTSEDSSMHLGIYGMPGVGKTRMMEQLWQQAKDEGIFNIVTRANVSEKLDVMDIQKQIAEDLNCKFESEESERLRASQLKNSLMGRGKILVILDDVWEDIPLDRIGISFADGSGCKILFTSRHEEVCLRNRCENPIKIKPLTSIESWELFSNIIEDSRRKPDKSLAEKVCDKCGGLPLVIYVVANALKFKPPYSWTDTLDQLENHNIKSVPGMSGDVYTCLKLSFDHLEEDAKACLLLCSQYPEDADIPIKELVQLATHIVGSGTSRVQAMLDILNSSSLLLKGWNKEHIKVHDIIRQVARSISAQDRKYAYLFERCGSSLPDHATLKLLRLDVEDADFHLQDDLVFSDLHTLSLRSTSRAIRGNPSTVTKLSGNVFLNLKLLMLENFEWWRATHFCLQPLGTLKTLLLDNCDIRYIGQTDVRFFPENLETLRFWQCDYPEPLVLPPLKYLKKLEITCAREAVILHRNTISSLSSLEELVIPCGFKIWENGQVVEEELTWDEICKLTRLKTLHILMRHVKPQDTTILSNLVEYNISLDKVRNYLPVSKVFVLTGDLVEGFQILMERSETVKLENSTVKVGLIWNINRQVYSDLKSLYIFKCHYIEYVTRIPHDHEIHQLQTTSFSKLIHLAIDRCPKLKYLFCNSVAKCLGQLQELYIDDCNEMEAIVMNEGTSMDGGDFLNFSNLKSMKLSNLPRLAGFYREKKSSTLFDRMVAFPSLEELKLNGLEEVSDIWGKDYCDDHNSSSSFRKLKSLKIHDCPELEFVSHHCNRLRNLSRGGAVEQEIIDGLIVFPDLMKLSLSKLPKLSNFGYHHQEQANMCRVKFPNLVDFKVKRCEEINMEAIEFGTDDSTCQLKRLIIICDYEVQLPFKWQQRISNLERLVLRHCGWQSQKSLFSFSAFKCLQLKELLISSCPLLEKIVEDARFDETSDLDMKPITLSHLKTVIIKDLPFLKTFCKIANYDCNFPALKKVKVNNCGLSNLFSVSATGSLEQLEELEISKCTLMEEIVEDVKGNEPSGMMDKKIITVTHLRTVILTDLPKLKSLFNGANYECKLWALKEVKVDNCGLTALFTCPVFRNLQHLEELRVSNCRMLQGIFEDVNGDETFKANDKIIKLSLLSSVVLRDLPKLKSFFQSGNYEFHMPALKKVEVDKCGLSALFTCPVFRTLEHLEKLQVSNCRMLEGIFEDVKGDETFEANDKIITLSLLSSVVLRDLPKFKSFVPSGNYEFHMKALKEVKVDNCGLSALFTCPIFRTLEHLKELKVSNCKMLEGIFEDVKGDETFEANDKIITLSLLSSVVLRDLPKLKSFFQSEKYEFHMKALKKVEVDNCEFFTLFKLSSFKNLQNLEYLKVSDCRLLESIVKDASGEECFDTNDDTIYLDQLRILHLVDLPKLKSFSRPARYAFCMPSLYRLYLRGCPELEIFTCTETRTNRIYVDIDGNVGRSVPDLNDYLKRYLRSRESDVTYSAGESSNVRNEDLQTELIRESKEDEQPNQEIVEC